MSPHAPHQRMHRHLVARAARPEPIPNPEPVAEPVQTIYSVVYVTASKTFAGDVAGYSTQGQVAASTTSSAQSSAQTSDSIVADTSSSNAQSSTNLDTSSLPTAISSPTASFESSIAILAASGTVSIASVSSVTRTGSSSQANSTSTASTTGGMSTGGKAGLIIGILLLVGAVLSLILFCFKRRRNALKEKMANDEKHEFQPVEPVARSPSAHNTPAPRLSLRPVTQFIPNLMDKRQSRGNNALMAPPANSPPAWDRPSTGQSSNRENPFGNHAETIDSPNANGPTVIQDTTSRGEIIPAAAAGAAAGVGAVTGATIGLARGASKRANAPPRMDFTTSGPFMGPPSPSGTEFSMNSDTGSSTPTQTATGVAIAAAGGPSHSAVHRVQLDFKPSMEDELELRAGQLIRMLHEYDDGWALCIRLDRSQQGVVPRTCLSTRPVKPRPHQNGPRGPPPPGMRAPQGMQPGRPMTPNGQQPRPMSPSQQQRPMTPSQQQRAMTPNGSDQFPLTPGQASPRSPAMVPLPASPSPGGRARSPSVAQQSGRKSPPGPSPMNNIAFVSGSPPTSAPIRKPVPGQAL